jgi:hypothetical protein
MARDSIEQVNAMQNQVAQQMARANDELHFQTQRAADLMKAQVLLTCRLPQL